MGRIKYQKEVESLFLKSPVVDFKSIERIIRYKKRVKQYAKQLVRNLVNKGKIKPLAKGYYSTYDDVSLAVFCFQPAYLGLQDALSFHKVWEQETIPVIVTSRKVRPGMRVIMGNNVLIRRISRKYFFGLDYARQGNFALPYSDLEKTFIDLVYFRENLSPNVMNEFRKRIDARKLRAYLKAYPDRFQRKIELRLKLIKKRNR